MIKATLRTRCGCERTLELSNPPPIELKISLVSMITSNISDPNDESPDPDSDVRVFRLTHSLNRVAHYMEVR